MVEYQLRFGPMRKGGASRMSDDVLESELLDVQGIDLDRLKALPDSVLQSSLSRILAERVDMPDRYTIHESSI